MSQRATVSGVKLILGYTMVDVDVVAIRQTNAKTKASFTNVCPSCEEPTKCNQEYQCPRCKGVYAPNERDKAKEVDGLLFRLTPEEIEAVKGAGADEDENPVKTMFVNVCARDELLARTRPGDTAYRLRPPKKGSKMFYNMLGNALEQGYGMYGILRLKEDSPTTPYMLDLWNGQIVLQQIIRPQDLAEVDFEVGTPGKYGDMAKELLARLCQPLDEELFVDGRIAKLDEILASKDVRDAVVRPLNEEDDVLAAIEASLAALVSAA